MSERLSGRTDRSARLTERNSGVWGTTSQDLLRVAGKLFRLSRDEANSRPDKNYSCFVYGGLPLLLASTQSFAIEYAGIGNLGPLPKELSAYLVTIMPNLYGVSGDLLQDLRDLVEVRNEIIHPSPLPTGTADSWPDYLRRVKEKGLVTTTSSPSGDYMLLAQIASHRLFAWAVEVTKDLYAAIINSNPAKAQLFQPVLHNFETLFG